MKKHIIALALLLIIPKLSEGQVNTTAKGIAMNCPLTFATPEFGSTEFVLFEFYSCDGSGNNCATTPEFTSPLGGLPVSDARYIHLSNTNPATCVTDFTTIPYPIGKVYIVKARFGNSIGISSPSNPSSPFQTLQTAPSTPINVRTWP